MKNHKKIPIVCIYVNESHALPLTLNHIYWTIQQTFLNQENLRLVLYFGEYDNFPLSWGYYDRKDFITLAEWREKQIDSILAEQKIDGGDILNE